MTYLRVGRACLGIVLVAVLMQSYLSSAFDSETGRSPVEVFREVGVVLESSVEGSFSQTEDTTGGRVLGELVALARATYAVTLSNSIPLVVGSRSTITGTVEQYGSPAENYAFGVEDGVGQRSFMTRTDSLGRFSFTVTPRFVGRATIRFFLGSGGSRTSVTKSVEIYNSREDLYRSVGSPSRFLDYYRLDVCNMTNPLVTCQTIGGSIYCGLHGMTVSYCGRDVDLPDGRKITATYSALSNGSVVLNHNQCLSDCYRREYMQSLENAAPCGELFCKALCAYQSGDVLEGLFWQLMYNLNCNYPSR